MAEIEEVVDEHGVAVELVVVVVVNEVDDKVVEVGEIEELSDEKTGKGAPASG